jgi:trehalose/maltose hydrolase-like predicted phosphorylase
VADRLTSPFDPATGMVEQFIGYFALEQIGLGAYSGRTVPMEAVLGRDRIKRSQLVKQADVVALFGLLPGEFDHEVQQLNFRRYETRCTHESSLSRPMHGLVSARLGDTATALRYFRTTAATDLAESARGTAGGVHIAALGGLWQVAIFGFAGLSWRNGILCVDPKLPASWQRLAFRVRWRGRTIWFCIGRDTVEATLEQGEPLAVTVRRTPMQLVPVRTASA